MSLDNMYILRYLRLIPSLIKDTMKAFDDIKNKRKSV